MSGKFNHFQAERINTIIINANISEEKIVFLKINESGSIIFLDPTNNTINVNLPPPEEGLNFIFIVQKTASNNITINSTNSLYSNTNLIYGNGVGGSFSSLPCAQLVLNSTHQTIGDSIQFICDGTNWFSLWNIKSTITSDQITGNTA